MEMALQTDMHKTMAKKFLSNAKLNATLAGKKDFGFTPASIFLDDGLPLSMQDVQDFATEANVTLCSSKTGSVKLSLV